MQGPRAFDVAMRHHVAVGDRSVIAEAEDDRLPEALRRAVSGDGVVDLLEEALLEVEVVRAPLAVGEVAADRGDVLLRQLLVEVLVQALQAVPAVHVLPHFAHAGAAPRVGLMPCSLACS